MGTTLTLKPERQNRPSPAPYVYHIVSGAGGQSNSRVIVDEHDLGI